MNRKNLIILLISIFIFSTTIFIIYKNWNKQEDNKLCEYAYVEKVYDWDTVLTDKLWKIRLLWIDAPEVYHPWWTKIKSYKFYWCWNESKQLAEKYLYHKNILFCEDPLANNKWWYWRYLRYAMVQSWNQQIPFWYISISKWMAQVYKYADFSRKEKYQELQNKVRQKHIWMWSFKCILEDRKYKNLK